MCTAKTLNLLLQEAQAELSKIFGNKLLNVVLYGSYARGDYDEESDIDIMALVDMDRDNLNKYRRCISEIANDIDLKYDVLLSIKLQDKPNFDKYKNSIPLYQNILKEGLSIGV